MNKESNIFTFTFAIIMVLIVGTVLAVTSEVLKPRKIKNEKDKKMIDILSAINVDATRINAQEQYTKFIYDESVINNKGELIEGSAFEVDVLFQNRDKTILPKDKKYPFFKAQKDGSEYVIIPMAGTGLWGPIWGFVSLKSDYKTVYGAAFAHKGETPGLGAEINTPEFENAFENKKIINDNGDFVSIKVKKGGADKESLYEVDGITGGTITSDGVAVMLEKTLQVYSDYFQSKEVDQQIDSLKLDTVNINLITL